VRTAFIEALTDAARSDTRIWLLCGDLGYSVLEPFAAAFPDRYVNVGVAEQNMTGVAAGLALSGNIVFTYSIANFPTLRCFEQVRNDVCYHNANVKIVSVGGGLSYGPQGYTHHGVEDLGVMRLLPGMTVVAPGDPLEARAAVTALIALDGPAYLRLGKAGEPRVHDRPIAFKLGSAIRVRDGDAATIIATGGVLAVAAAAARELADNGIDVRLVSMHTLAPLDTGEILRAADETGGLVIVEEHGIGGLGTAVSETLVDQQCAVRVRRIGLPREAMRRAGSQDFLRAFNGISVTAIVDAVLALSGGGRLAELTR
jgi:transketolase